MAVQDSGNEKMEGMEMRKQLLWLEKVAIGAMLIAATVVGLFNGGRALWRLIS